jgi:hypothetical protein
VKRWISKLRAALRRPFAQIMIMIILAGAAGDATERLIKLYRDGAPLTVGVIGWHLLALIVLILTFKQFDRIEARMKAGEAA